MHDVLAAESDGLTFHHGRKNAGGNNGFALYVKYYDGKPVFFVSETYLVDVAAYIHYLIAFFSASALSVFSHGNAGLPK